MGLVLPITQNRNRKALEWPLQGFLFVVYSEIKTLASFCLLNYNIFIFIFQDLYNFWGYL